jgi:GntR family transcriptional regulator
MQNETQVFQNKTLNLNKEPNREIDRFNQEKLYIQLMRIFLEQINSGNWQLGQQIPTEEDLCKKYNVSKITVRQAINNLVADGYLIKIHGKGTFVASSLPVAGLAMKTRLTEDMFGEEVKVDREILSAGLKMPPHDAKGYLRTEGETHYFLGRRVVNGQPEFIEESYIPQDMLPDAGRLDIVKNSLYSVLQERAVKKIFKVVQTVEVVRADGDYAENLDVPDGTPVLAIHRLFLSADRTPVAYTKLLGRSDRYKFQTEFERIR